MVIIILQFTHGAAAGSLYGLLGIAVALMVRGNVAPNPALGAVATLSALTAYWFADRLDLPFPALVLLGMLAGGALAAIVELATVVPLGRPGVLRQTPFAPMLAAIAAWIGLDALAGVATGPAGVSFPAGSMPATVFGSDDNILSLIDLFCLFVGFAGAGLIHWMLVGSRFGNALSAIRYDALAAALGGVNPRRMLLLASALAGVLAGAVGVCAAAASSLAGGSVGVELGQGLIWKAIATVVLSGGLATRNVAASRVLSGHIMAIGLLLGIVENGCALTLPQHMPLTPWQGDAAAALLLLIVLRPSGLFASRTPMPPR